jgi:hypothetical protein
MSDLQWELAREEFASLRATIRQRGSLRVTLFLATIIAWGMAVAASATTATIPAPPIATLLPLLVLSAGLEAVAALHFGAERIGRYLEARFEAAAPGPAWEATTTAWGQRFPGTGTDPLFAVVFLLAVLLNAVPLALDAAIRPMLAAAQLLPHGLLLWRILHLRAWARRQRIEDLARFRELLEAQQRDGR